MLEVSHLTVDFLNRTGSQRVVDDFNLTMDQGEVVGIVGESGSGKSMTAQSIMGLIDRSKVRVGGSARFEGEDLFTMDRAKLRQYQGKELSIIFQEPMTSLNPVMRIGRQVEEALLIHTDMTAQERRERALEALAEAELPDPASVYEKYPHQLSGGMRQRVMIAAALVLRPKLLIADEPSTALDVTIQAQIIKLLKKINQEQHTAILFISHDLGVVRKLCSRVVVMNEGKIVEEGPVEEVFLHPREDYTKLLIASRPTRVRRKGENGHV